MTPNLLLLTGPLGALAAEVELAPPTTIATPMAAIADAALVDVDDDGQLDVALCGEGPVPVGWLLRDGTSFSWVDGPAILGTRCTAIGAGDFDADGKKDLIVSDEVGSGVIYLDSAGSAAEFRPRTVAEWGIRDFYVADVNLDGVDDYAMVFGRDGDGDGAEDSFSAVVRLGPGLAGRSGSWSSIFNAQLPGATEIAAADFDDDGLVDLAWVDAVGGGAGIVFQDLADPSGNASIVPLANPGSAQALLVADLDRDGIPEPVVVGEVGGLYAELSSGAVVQLPVGAPEGELADWDRDGRLELVGVGASGYTVGELAWDASLGQTLDRTRTLAPFVGPATPRTLRIDVDGDADEDLLIIGEDGLHLSINLTPHPDLYEYPDPLFGNGPLGPSPGLVRVGDFDGDAWPDLLVGDGAGIAGFAVYLNPRVDVDGRPPVNGQSLGWSAQTFASTSYSVQSELLDHDQDGDLDVVGVRQAGGLDLFLNGGDGASWTAVPIDATATCLVPADIDGDRDRDLVVGAAGIRAYLTEGAGAPSWVDLYPPDAVPWSTLAAGDVDGDGDADVIGLHGAEVALLLNTGPAGGWPLHSIVSVPPTATVRRVALADFDGDGVLDLFVDHLGTSSAAGVFTHGGDPTQPWSELATGSSGSSTGAGQGMVVDLDLDGTPDAVTTNGFQQFYSRFNRELGQFENSRRLVQAWDEVAMSDAGDLFYAGRPWLVQGGPTGTLRVAPITPRTSELSVGTGPQAAERATWTSGRAPLTLEVFHDGLPIDAELVPGILEVGATLDGVALTATELLELVGFQLRLDQDWDGDLDPSVDPAFGLLPEVLPGEDVRLRVDLTTASEGAPGYDGPGSLSRSFFLEVIPTFAGSARPLADLAITVREGAVPVTLPSGSAVDHASNPSDHTAVVVIGNTLPPAPELRVTVPEGGLVEFDPLAGLVDPDGDALVSIGPVAAPPVGVVEQLGGSTLRYTHDGSEGPEVALLVEVGDGIETVLRLVVLEVGGVDDPPTGADLDLQTVEDVQLDFELVGLDPDDVTTLEITQPPSSGTLATTAGPDRLEVAYTPDANFVGQDALTYVVRGGPLVSEPYTVTLHVLATDQDDDDGDGVIDALDACPETPDPLQQDLDSDGIGDACDDDDDGDGLVDAIDPCPAIPEPLDTGADDPCTDDDDADGVLDGLDNCLHLPNPDQTDLDGDLRGDACDPDDDGDGVADDDDNCPASGNRSQQDTDGDGVGDACEDDDDDDGVTDDDDVCPWTFDPGQADADADGTGDACDGDRDGDGSPTELDCDDDEPGVWSPLTFYQDGDGDGLGDPGAPAELCSPEPPAGYAWDGTDNCPDQANPDQTDADGDGLGDVCDASPAPSDTEGEGCGCNAESRGAGLLLWTLMVGVLPRRRRA